MKENISKFQNLINTDTDLQAKIQDAMADFNGDKSDEKEVFDSIIAPIAADAGCEFSYDELVESHKSSDEPLDDEELEAVSGGKSFCIIIGFGSKVEADFGNQGVGACAYVGIGAGLFDKDDKDPSKTLKERNS